MYAIGLNVLIIIWIVFPFFYANIWKYKVINKSTDFFDVSKIELMTLTGKKTFFLYGGMFIYWWLWVETSENKSGTEVILIFAGFTVVWGLLACLFCREHTALPLAKLLNVNEMINSIEAERFSPIGERLWHSAHWIRISTKFFPKSAVLGMKVGISTHSSDAEINVFTVYGKQYACGDFSKYDKTLQERVENLINTLPVNELTGGKRIELSDLLYFEGKPIVNEYMKSHTTTEFINRTEVLEKIVTDLQISKQKGK